MKTLPPPSRPAAPQVAVAAKAVLSKKLDGFPATFLQTDLAIGRQAVLVDAESRGACGMDVGCPHVILFRTARGWSPCLERLRVLEGDSHGTSHSGLRYVALADKHAFYVLTSDGTSYRDSHMP